MTATPDPLVLARLQKIAETTDGPSLVQAYMDLLTFGPTAFDTVLAFAHGEIDLSLPPDDPAEARRAVLGVLAWLGHRYPDELFAALGDPRFVTPAVACTIEPIDDPRTAPILLAAVDHDDDTATAILLPGLGAAPRRARAATAGARVVQHPPRAPRARGGGPVRDGTGRASPPAMRPALDAEPDAEVRCDPHRRVARTEDPGDTRDLRWFWVVVRPRLAEYGVAAFDADDALAVLAEVRYRGREAPSIRSVTDMVAEPVTERRVEAARRAPCLPGMWAPTDTSVWQSPP